MLATTAWTLEPIAHHMPWIHEQQSPLLCERLICELATYHCNIVPDDKVPCATLEDPASASITANVMQAREVQLWPANVMQAREVLLWPANVEGDTNVMRAGTWEGLSVRHIKTDAPCAVQRPVLDDSPPIC